MKASNVNPDILKQLLEKNPEKEELVKKKFPKYIDWVEGKDFPTNRQLIKLSKIFNIPFIYFFSEKLLDITYTIPHYSSIENEKFIPSDELMNLLFQVKLMQNWTKKFLTKHNMITVSYWGKYKNNYDLEEVVKKIKNILNIYKNQTKLELKTLIKYLEKNDIIVKDKDFENTKKESSFIYEFTGLVLYDEVVPVVFVNGNDNIFVKILSLILSICYILIGENASFDLRNFKYPTNEIEQFCHKCAKEIIEPIEYFEEGTLFPKIKRNKINFVELDKKTYLEIMNQK